MSSYAPNNYKAKGRDVVLSRNVTLWQHISVCGHVASLPNCTDFSVSNLAEQLVLITARILIRHRP